MATEEEDLDTVHLISVARPVARDPVAGPSSANQFKASKFVLLQHLFFLVTLQTTKQQSK